MARDGLNLSRDQGGLGPASKNRPQPPQTVSYYKPSYKMLNYTTWNTDVSGQVDFYRAMGDAGQKMFDSIIQSEEETQLVNTYNGINQELSRKAREWKNNSESGEGYLEYVSSEHSKLSQQALSGIINPLFAGRMKQMLLKSKADWENGAFEEEQAMRTSHSLRTAREAINELCIGIVNNPFNYDSGVEAMGHALESYRNIAGQQAFDTEYAKSMKEFTYCYGMGLVQKDPHNFMALAKEGRLNVLTPEQLMRLNAMADGEITRRANQAKRAEQEIEQLKVTNDVVATHQIYQAMLDEGADSVSDTTIQNSGASPTHQQEIKEFKGHLRKAEQKQLETTEAMQLAAYNSYGIGSFTAAQQLDFLRKTLLADENGEKTKSPRDIITIANNIGVSVEDKRFGAVVFKTITTDNSANKVLKYLDAYHYAEATGCKLLPKPGDDTLFIIGHMTYSGGGDPELTMKAREEAKERLERLNRDPIRKAALAQYANEYVKETNNDYVDLRKDAWKAVSDGFDDMVPWYKYWADEEKQYLESKYLFNTTFGPIMKNLISLGWEPHEAAQEVQNQFMRSYGPTYLVQNKLMMHPPERQYPGISPKELMRRFKNFANQVVTGYTKQNIKPSGYELSIVSKREYPTLKYDNGAGSKGEAPLNLEWSEKKKAYEVYLIRSDGTRIYLTKPDGNLQILNFNNRRLIDAK